MAVDVVEAELPQPTKLSADVEKDVGGVLRVTAVADRREEGVVQLLRRQRQRDTSPEVELRRQLHRLGLRFRVDRRVLPSIRRRADIVFGPSKVAVFVDGCFWHRCPEHGTLPKANAQWWADKLDRNVERDRDTDEALSGAHWLALRVWEHEDMSKAALAIFETVTARRCR